VLVKGADYTLSNVVGADLVIGRGGKVVLAELLSATAPAARSSASADHPAVSAPAAADKVVILDRDGTIVVDRGYLCDPSKLEFEPKAAEGLKWLYSHGYRLVVITNQSGIGRDFLPSNSWMQWMSA